MSTLRQIEANRRNALKSTGPRTAAGKTASSSNALQHGVYANSPVLTGEDSAEYQTLARSYEERFQPATPEEQTLLVTIIRNAWYLDRYQLVETELWNGCLDQLEIQEPGHKFPMAESYIALHGTLARLQRRIDAAHRAFHSALTLLNKLQAQRKQELPAENGFVPSKHVEPAKRAAEPVQIAPPSPRPAPRDTGFPPFPNAS